MMLWENMLRLVSLEVKFMYLSTFCWCKENVVDLRCLTEKSNIIGSLKLYVGFSRNVTIRNIPVG